jgi:hypothetical protein
VVAICCLTTASPIFHIFMLACHSVRSFFLIDWKFLCRLLSHPLQQLEPSSVCQLVSAVPCWNHQLRGWAILRHQRPTGNNRYRSPSLYTTRIKFWHLHECIDMGNALLSYIYITVVY